MSGSSVRLRSETPSSILSSDSDIRFTRKLGEQYRCGCYITAGFLVFLLIATLSLYAAYMYLAVDSKTEKVFRGVVRVVEGDSFTPDLADPATENFRVHSREYKEGLNLWLRRSELKPAFASTDILAFDGEESEDLKVHFNLHFNTWKMAVTADDIMRVLSRNTTYLGNKTLDSNSLLIKEANGTPPSKVGTTPAVEFPTTTPSSRPVRKCAAMELTYCAALKTNKTSYPNIIGHKDVGQVQSDLIAFRELIDAECYRSAYDFLCQVLQPPCSSELVVPCQNFCKEFWDGCGKRIPLRLQKALNCSNFPEYSAEGPPCIPKPGCGIDLESKGLENYLCDGVADCPDLSDESSCPHCPKDSLHCSSSKTCIEPEKQCDGKEDCPDGSDERACLSLAPSLQKFDPIKSVQSRHYHTRGHVVFTEKGKKGKLCIENVNKTVGESELDSTLNTIASSLCRTLSFRKMDNVHMDLDNETESEYVSMTDPKATEIKFIPSDCPSKEVLSVQCSEVECGISTVRKKEGIEGLAKMSNAGDWPWHVPLFKDGIHVCDGTLIDLDWVITTASCFQGQGKAEWIARAGTIRLASTTPWQQQRHVVGMVKSPVEGSTVVMLKVNKPFTPSDFVRPVCLPPKGSAFGENLKYCNTLGWTTESAALQRIELKLLSLDFCSAISIAPVNSVCTAGVIPQGSSYTDCSEEEVAGSPMLCLHPDGKKWVLAGVSNWRIACAKNGDDRPRLYDSIISNIDWILSNLDAS